MPPTVTRLVYKTVIQPKFLYAASITYPKQIKDQIAVERVNKYAASLISDRHTGSYDECIRSASLDPVWKIVVQRRLSLFRAYLEERRFIPEGFLTAKKPVTHSGLRSSNTKANENRQQFEKPIKSLRHQCETTALSEMITYWNILPNSVIDLTTTGFKTRIKSGDIVKYLIDAKTVKPLEVPVRYPIWSVKKP